MLLPLPLPAALLALATGRDSGFRALERLGWAGGELLLGAPLRPSAGAPPPAPGLGIVPGRLAGTPAVGELVIVSAGSPPGLGGGPGLTWLTWVRGSGAGILRGASWATPILACTRQVRGKTAEGGTREAHAVCVVVCGCLPCCCC